MIDMHTGRIIAYAAIGGVSAFGAFMLYKHLKNRGPAINEAAADKLPAPVDPTGLKGGLMERDTVTNPVTKFRAYSRDAVSLTSGVRGAVPRFAMRDDGHPVTRFRAYSRDAVSLTSGVRGAVPRFAMRDDGHETGTQIFSYIPSMSLGGDGVATGSGVATVDTANEIRARSTRQSINPDTVRV
jgi:hypothetical protein